MKTANKTILGLVGSRTFENKRKIKEFISSLRTIDNLEIVGLGDKFGADQHIKKYALELGLNYKEMNPAHTVKNLYSLMSEAYYNKPYNPKNFHQQIKIYSQYINSCVLFDDSNFTDKKIKNVFLQLNRMKKRTIILTP